MSNLNILKLLFFLVCLNRKSFAKKENEKLRNNSSIWNIQGRNGGVDFLPLSKSDIMNMQEEFFNVRRRKLPELDYAKLAANDSSKFLNIKYQKKDIPKGMDKKDKSRRIKVLLDCIKFL